MRIIKGVNLKSVKMAELFRAEDVDLLIDYGGGARWDIMLPNGSGVMYVDPSNIALGALLEQLTPTIITHNPFALFLYGNFRSEMQVDAIREWAENFPTLRLTITQQAEGEIEILEV